MTTKRNPTTPKKDESTPATGRPKGEFGEGNYVASRHYREATEQFVKEGKVDGAARDAAPRNAKDDAEMKKAEEVGRARAKEEDPAVERRPRPAPETD